MLHSFSKDVVDESKASDEGEDESEKELYMPRAPQANEKGPRFVTKLMDKNVCQLGWLKFRLKPL